MRNSDSSGCSEKLPGSIWFSGSGGKGRRGWSESVSFETTCQAQVRPCGYITAFLSLLQLQLSDLTSHLPSTLLFQVLRLQKSLVLDTSFQSFTQTSTQGKVCLEILCGGTTSQYLGQSTIPRTFYSLILTRPTKCLNNLNIRITSPRPTSSMYFLPKAFQICR